MRSRRWEGSSEETLAPVMADQPVVAHRPVARLRIAATAIVLSLSLTALYVWGLQLYVDGWRTVRDRQYEQTQERLTEQQNRIGQLERDRVANERRIGELERRLKVSPSVAP